MRKILEGVGIGVLGASTIITLYWRFIQSAFNTKIASKVPSESFAFQTRRRIMYVAVPAMMLTSGLRQKS